MLTRVSVDRWLLDNMRHVLHSGLSGGGAASSCLTVTAQLSLSQGAGPHNWDQGCQMALFVSCLVYNSQLLGITSG
jgi:hypothetical protein